MGRVQGDGLANAARCLDLFAEFRRLTSGLGTPAGSGLLGALAYHGIEGMAASEKDSKRDLAIRGGPFTPAEQADLLAYCAQDVAVLVKLLKAMLPRIDLPRALLRGRYMQAAARMEAQGTPIDVATLNRLRTHWDRIKARLIEVIDRDYGVFVPTARRTLDPDTRLGAAVLAEAPEYGVDPYLLADAVDHVWRQEKQVGAESREARQAARQATGLTHKAIDRWEDAGRDSSTWPDLDGQAAELAGAWPALGLAEDGDGEATQDMAGRLWADLRDRDETVKPKWHPDILRQATELVLSGPAPSIYQSGSLSFSTERWGQYLALNRIPWPRLESGTLALDDDTFREMRKAYPAQVGPIRELRHTLGQMRLNELAVGPDGRNRCLLSAFRSKTGRNQPSNSAFIFGPSCWLRSLIKPAEGRAVAYCDWSQQELAIAAALSGDAKMQEAYQSGDFYLTFGKMAGAIPPDGTKSSHAAEREQFKVVSLGVLYGLSAEGLARRLGVPRCRGRELLQMHQETFRQFWKWSDEVQDRAMLLGRLDSVFGWRVHAGPQGNPRSMRNFPMQANGAEMMRLACCLATERGIEVCCPVHDALLVEGPADEIDAVVEATQAAMREASLLVLPGFPLRTEAKVVCWPDRYMDPGARSCGGELTDRRQVISG